jgi:2-phospho-L-lactate/phosphoenolpyruvate guanylyltransferase
MTAAWVAFMPFNFGSACKTRLANIMPSEKGRHEFAFAMAGHVAQILTTNPHIAIAYVLSPVDPELPGMAWMQDKGCGLNAELVSARQDIAGRPTLMIHADLPLLSPNDLNVLLNCARKNEVGLAPDRLGIGTNAIADFAAPPFVPCFGDDSFRKHQDLFPRHKVVSTTGLAIDIDDLAGMKAALTCGFDPAKFGFSPDLAIDRSAT